MLFSKSKTVVAVELGSDTVRAVAVTPGKPKPSLKFFASQAVADGAPDTLPERQLTALGDLLKSQRLPTREILATLPTTLLVTRIVQLDTQKKESPDEQILAALQNSLPFDSKDLQFDHWPINPSSDGPRSEVLVVAAQASVVRRYLVGLGKMGIDCTHLDVAPCALASLITLTQTNTDAIVGGIALSRDLGFFAITERTRVLFWRPFDLSGVARDKGISVAGIEANLERVGDEISKCVSHMVGTMHLDNLAEVLLFGYGSDDQVVGEYLKNRFHVPVRAPSPFEPLELPQDVINDKQATHYCTAMGLALQQLAGV